MSVCWYCCRSWPGKQVTSYLSCIVLSCVVCLAAPYLSTLSNKLCDFRGEKLLNIKCVFWFSLQICPKHFTFWEEFSEIWSSLCIGTHINCQLFLSDFNDTWILSTDFGKPQVQNLMNIRPVGTDLFHADRKKRADGRTDRRDRTLSRISQFCDCTYRGCLKPEASPVSVLVKGRHLRSFKCCTSTDNKHTIF
jgi:hypothetical protein